MAEDAAPQEAPTPVVAPAKLKIRTDADEAVITVDGEVRGLAPRVESLPPGVHTIVAETRGAPPLTQTVSLSAGEERQLELRFDYPQKPGVFPAVGTLMFAAGGVLVVGSLLLRTRAEVAGEQVTTLFERGGGWDATAQAIERDGLAAQTWSWVLMTTGVAMAASGVVVGVLEILGLPRSRPTLVLAPMPGGGFVSGAWAW